MERSAANPHQRLYETLVGALGSPAMGPSLLRGLDEIAQAREVFCFNADGEGPPRPLISESSGTGAGARVRAYTARYHGADPLGDSLRAAATSRLVFRRIAASEIGDPEYRYECFEKPRFGEKISLVLPRSQGWLVLSLYRSHHDPVTPQLRDSLVRFAGLALPLLRKHDQLLNPASERAGGFPERMAARLAEIYPALTRREREVCARTLAGMTAEAIGLDLRIGATSVLTYRRRAYERLGVSGVNQLLPELLA